MTTVLPEGYNYSEERDHPKEKSNDAVSDESQ
jgi:hypothetical protein